MGSVSQAVSYLGLGVLRALALNAHVLGAVEGTTISRATLDAVQRSSLATATVAKQKIRDRKLADDAFTAGIVHDIGKLVVALGMPGKFREIDDISHATGRAPHVVEEELLGVSHAEVGAYLLGVLGPPLFDRRVHGAPSRARARRPGAERALARHSPRRCERRGARGRRRHARPSVARKARTGRRNRSLARRCGGILRAPRLRRRRGSSHFTLMGMDNKSRPRVLCVDDEPNVLEGVSLHLHRRYEVVTATSGAAGLAALEKDGSIAVVMSDMRMPQMDGAQFLSRVRTGHPNAVRLLLTGQADMQSAIAAINEGQIFRFLTKPCPPAQLLGAFEAAIEQHRLLVAERILLEQR